MPSASTPVSKSRRGRTTYPEFRKIISEIPVGGSRWVDEREVSVPVNTVRYRFYNDVGRFSQRNENGRFLIIRLA